MLSCAAGNRHRVCLLQRELAVAGQPGKGTQQDAGVGPTCTTAGPAAIVSMSNNLRESFFGLAADVAPQVP